LKAILQILDITVFLILLYENVYDKQPNTIQPFGLRVKSHFENSDINLDDIAPIVIPENPPWLNPRPTFNFELA
jgi:hypothetical protein